MSWTEGRRLATASATGKSLSFAYDFEGIRTTKTVTAGGQTTTHKYTTESGNIVCEQIYTGSTLTATLYFIYDAAGQPFALKYSTNGTSYTTYYYVLNLQGDVVGLISASGSYVAKYTYDTWGNLLSVTNASGTAITSSTHIANRNPLRYRGYYYDTETGFYYLQSRYYDPVSHRFINADGTPSTGQEISGTNMFAYCGNNPVARADDGGEFWNIVIGAVVGVVSQYVADVVTSLASGESFAEALVPTSSVADYLGAAASGALAATGIGLAGAVAANAAIGGATYLANSAIDGDTPNWSGFATAATIGAVSGLIGGSGLSGAKVTGIKKTAKAVLKTAVSPKKIAMYTAKIAACNKAVTIAIVRTAASVHGGIILNKVKDYAMEVIDE